MRNFESRPAASLALKEVRYTKADRIATIMIDRPANHNAYSTNALRELQAAFHDAAYDDAVGVIVLTGSGTRAFCTGGDVKEYQASYTSIPRDYWKYMGLFQAYIESIVNSGKPVIARLNGMAVGGGSESQLACDLAVMAEHAWTGQVGTRVGSVAAGGATQWLALHVGDRRAREMLLLNERIPAAKALDWGLVNRVVPSVTKDGTFITGATAEQIEKAHAGKEGYAIDLTRLDEEVKTLALRLLEQFPECQRYTKQSANFWKDFSWHQTIGHAREWLTLHYASLEPWEGMRAFVEKRPADYRGVRDKMGNGGSSEFVWGAYEGDCGKCGAKGIPTGFAYCGNCGATLVAMAKNGAGK